MGTFISHLSLNDGSRFICSLKCDCSMFTTSCVLEFLLAGIVTLRRSPYLSVRVFNDVTYKVWLGRKKFKVFHFNLLKACLSCRHASCFKRKLLTYDQPMLRIVHRIAFKVSDTLSLELIENYGLVVKCGTQNSRVVFETS